MNWKRVEGSDGVEIEIAEAAGNKTDLANLIYSTEQVPDMTKYFKFLVISKQKVRWNVTHTQQSAS